MVLKQKKWNPELTGETTPDRAGIEFSQYQLINGDFTKGGQMKKISTVLMKDEITAKFLNNKMWGASDRPGRRPFVLAVEPEQSSEKGEVPC